MLHRATGTAVKMRAPVPEIMDTPLMYTYRLYVPVSQNYIKQTLTNPVTVNLHVDIYIYLHQHYLYYIFHLFAFQDFFFIFRATCTSLIHIIV
jgi:hypothetical protein